MHKRHSTVGKSRTEQQQTQQPRTLKLRDIAEVKDLEAKLWLNETRDGHLQGGAGAALDKVSQMLFGNVVFETMFVVDDDASGEHDGLETAKLVNNEPPRKAVPLECEDLVVLSDEEVEELRDLKKRGSYVTDYLSEDEIVEFFDEHNIDFRDERGHPLKCTTHLCRQAEAAVKGIVGRVAKVEELFEQQWEQSLTNEAKAFCENKNRRQSRNSPEQQPKPGKGRILKG